VTVWDVDNITDAAADAAALVVAVVADLAATDDAATGAGMVGYSGSLAYASGTVGGELLKAGVLRSGRTAPHANFAWFTADFTVTGCAGVGKATVQEDIYDVWMSKYGPFMTGSTTWLICSAVPDHRQGHPHDRKRPGACNAWVLRLYRVSLHRHPGRPA
jgi:hypothetical protein